MKKKKKLVVVVVMVHGGRYRGGGRRGHDDIRQHVGHGGQGRSDVVVVV